MNYPTFFEYTKAATPIIKDLEVETLNPSEYKSIRTPNLEAYYIVFGKTDLMEQDSKNASSHVFYVLKGSGCTMFGEKEIAWKKGDVFTFPYGPDGFKHYAYNVETILFYVNDSPLIKYLNCKPNKPRFEHTFYSDEEIKKRIDTYNNQEGAKSRNRNGVLLSNYQFENESLNTLTHSLWSLMNYIGPNTKQNPHKHNSIAIDLCTELNEESENKVYTLMSKTINENNELVDPIKVFWKKDCTFTTPPGWWHSHHNESEYEAWVFPIQDAGLHTYMRTLDIQFVK